MLYISNIHIACKRLLLVLAVGLLLFSCHTTKYVPSGESLLNKVEIKSVSKNLSKQELKSYIRQRENTRIFGLFRFKLGVYNLSGADTSKGFNRWLRRIGEEPVVFEDYLSDVSINQLQLLLHNKGYFNSLINDTVLQVKDKKVNVRYTIRPGKRYRINQVRYGIEDDSIRQLVMSDTLKTVLKKERPYDSDLHEQERNRITSRLQNMGYYAFSKEYIYFVADSSVGQYLVNDSLIIKKMEVIDEDGTSVFQKHKKYKYNNVFFVLGSMAQRQTDFDSIKSQPFDTIDFAGCYFLYRQKIDVHPSVLINSSFINPGELFSAANVDKTRLLLSGLRSFRYVDIKFYETASTDSVFGAIDAYIQVVSADKQAFTIEVEGTNSSGNLGAAGNIKYQHRNLLRGAEVLDVSLRSSMERQFVRGTRDKFNTTEFGTDFGLELPVFLVPYRIESFRKRYNPKTTIGIAYNYQRRPDYTRTIANIRFGYNWRTSRYVSHYLFPIELNLVQLPYVHPDFWDEIRNTFLRYSYEDHFIVNSAYSFVFNNQTRAKQPEFVYGRFNLELAGNTLNALARIWQKSDSSGVHSVFDIQYSQYLKADVDFRYHHSLNRANSLSYRFFAGVGYPYGNTNVIPFEKRYFSGGANGIRAWPVRGLGPGEFVDTVSTFYNQTADIKLELNAEYRTKLFWILESAIFIDAGNIWSIRKDASPEGGLFQWNRFIKQMAVGVGLGLRFDFDYFLFRIDAGLKARDPIRPAGERWLIGNEPVRWSNMAFNFAIGYPF